MRNIRFIGPLILLSAVAVVVCFSGTHAGELAPPEPPHDPASAGFTLKDLYQQLTTGNPGAKRTGAFPEPPGAPAGQGYTIDQIQAALPEKNEGSGASTQDVACNKLFWGLRGDGWGLQTGTRGAQSWYPDGDGDGYGDTNAQPVVACVPPAGHVANHADCNDADPAIHPDAADTDNDGIDSDCNGHDSSRVWDVVIKDGDGWLINLNQTRVRSLGGRTVAISYEGELRYTQSRTTYTGPAVALYLADSDSITITATDSAYDRGELTYSLRWTSGPNMTGGYIYKKKPRNMNIVTATLIRGNVGGHSP